MPDGGRGAGERNGSHGFSLRRRLQWLVAALVAVIVLPGVIALLIIDNRDRALDTIVFSLDPASAAVLRLEAALVDQQAAVNGFVLVRREDVLEPFQRARGREEAALDELDQRLGDTELAALVPGVRAAIREWRTDVVEPQLFSTRAGREAEARALATTGQELYDAARGEVRQLSGRINQRLAREQSSFRSARRAVAETVAVNAVVATLLLIAVTVLLRKWVTDPLDSLRAQVATVSSGDLERAIRPSGPIELASMGEGIEAMRVRILSELLEARRAEEGLAQRAPAIAALRNALAPRVEAIPTQFEAAIHFEPAEGVLAGDWYLVSRLPSGKVAFCIGDVAGHGAVSAIVALRARDLLLAGLTVGQSPGEALSLVSNSLDTGDDETFVTCFAALIDADGSIEYANGGHPPALLVAQGEVEELSPTGPLLGVLPGAWRTESRLMEPGATLVVYTDGVVEATGSSGEEYGLSRLVDVAGQARTGAGFMVNAIATDFRALGSERTRDDVTVVALSRRA